MPSGWVGGIGSQSLFFDKRTWVNRMGGVVGSSCSNRVSGCMVFPPCYGVSGAYF